MECGVWSYGIAFGDEFEISFGYLHSSLSTLLTPHFKLLTHLIILPLPEESKGGLPVEHGLGNFFVQLSQSAAEITAEMHKESAPFRETLAGMRLASGGGMVL